MKILLTAALSFCNLLASAQPICNCTPSTEKDHQDRTDAKHAANYDDFILKEDTVDIAYVSKWQSKYKTKTNTITKSANGANSQRQHNTPEDSLYIFKGYMWFVKKEGNDCDFHIEIGNTNVYRTRFVVEVPRENNELQQKIKQHLDDLGLKIMGCGTTNTNVAHFDHPLKCVVIGLGFYDASHKPNTNHGDVHTKRYSWELHPVKDIIFK